MDLRLAKQFRRVKPEAGQARRLPLRQLTVGRSVQARQRRRRSSRIWRRSWPIMAQPREFVHDLPRDAGQFSRSRSPPGSPGRCTLIRDRRGGPGQRDLGRPGPVGRPHPRCRQSRHRRAACGARAPRPVSVRILEEPTRNRYLLPHLADLILPGAQAEARQAPRRSAMRCGASADRGAAGGGGPARAIITYPVRVADGTSGGEGPTGHGRPGTARSRRTFSGRSTSARRQVRSSMTSALPQRRSSRWS